MSRFEDGYEAATRRDADVQRGGAVKEVDGGAGWETLLVQKGGHRAEARVQGTGYGAFRHAVALYEGERRATDEALDLARDEGRRECLEVVGRTAYEEGLAAGAAEADSD